MKARIKIYFIGVLTLAVGSSCKKYLDAKPASNYATISTISDAQSTLDDPDMLNVNSIPHFGEFLADNYYFSQENYEARRYSGIANVYIWGKNPFPNDPSGGEWGYTYNGILVCNTAIEALDHITATDAERQTAANARGMALASRGYKFWKLAINYCKAYDMATAGTDLGIPLRLDAGLTTKLTRGTLSQTYDQVLKDLTNALQLLPNQPSVISRPSKLSVNAMLAEVYLSMRNYQQAAIYADASLAAKHELIDYNTLNAALARPIPVFKDNKEILLWYSAAGNEANFFNSTGMDTVLYRSYKDGDLRKRFFFTARTDGSYYFSGNYSLENEGCFSGPTTAEMYLIRAECYARQGKTDEAMQDLNQLMKNRMINTPGNPFVPFTAVSAQDALQQILNERRKELVFRDYRWMDIKRLNMEGANITITRHIDGKIITLLPNDNHGVLQLPESAVTLGGLEQNPYN